MWTKSVCQWIVGPEFGPVCEDKGNITTLPGSVAGQLSWGTVTVLMVLGVVCDQKILVFVLQMEKSKQSRWMEWGKVDLLIEGITCPDRWGKGSRKRGPGSPGRLVLYHFELGGGETLCQLLAPFTCRLGEEALELRGGAVPDYP
jgi:hypothetical protein